MTRVSFVMEQHIGHQTYYQNLRHAVDQDRRIDATWASITYHGISRFLDHTPLLPRDIRGTIGGMIQVRRALDEVDSEVVFLNTQVPGALAGRRIFRRPYVIATDITPLQYDRMSQRYGHKPDGGGPLAAYKRHVNTRLLRGAAGLLPWSNWASESLVKDYGVDPARIEVVPPGVDLHRWRPGSSRREGPLRILFVGGDLFRKGGATLLEAFRALPRGMAELHLVTHTPLEREEAIHIYRNMSPNSDELTALYRSADVFALPTEAEAFGIAAIEACAVGLATITTAVGGLVDIVADGESGYLIAPGDVAALRAHLCRLATDMGLRTRMGRAARARAEQQFDSLHNAGRVIAHLLKAAAQSRSEARLVKTASGG